MGKEEINNKDKTVSNEAHDVSKAAGKCGVEGENPESQNATYVFISY
jgi:hypothetical protein